MPQCVFTDFELDQDGAGITDKQSVVRFPFSFSGCDFDARLTYSPGATNLLFEAQTHQEPPVAEPSDEYLENLRQAAVTAALKLLEDGAFCPEGDVLTAEHPLFKTKVALKLMAGG